MHYILCNIGRILSEAGPDIYADTSVAFGTQAAATSSRRNILAGCAVGKVDLEEAF